MDRFSWCQNNPIWRITNQAHAMLQRSMPCCQSSLLPVWFWMQLGMLRETQHRFLGTLLELFFYIFLKVRRFPVAEKMAGSRPRCPTSRKFLLTVLDTGVMFHENAEAAKTTWVGLYCSQVGSTIPVYKYALSKQLFSWFATWMK